MTNQCATPKVLEEARWFGPPEGRLFGWLMWPDTETVRGGVILAQPLGREARAARRAMRSLGIELAKKGFVAVRLDYPGTGDSSGSLDEIDVQRAWVDAIGEAAAFLQSFGLTDVSAVGMRLGPPCWHRRTRRASRCRRSFFGTLAKRGEASFERSARWSRCVERTSRRPVTVPL